MTDEEYDRLIVDAEDRIKRQYAGGMVIGLIVVALVSFAFGAAVGAGCRWVLA